MRRDVGHCLILDDPAARQILVLRLTFTPCGNGFQPAEQIGLAPRDADAFPGLFGFVDIIGRIGQPLHFLIKPATTAGLAQSFEHLGE